MISKIIMSVAFAIFLTGCFKPDDYLRSDADGLISFISGDETLIADGVSTSIIKVKVADNASSGRKKVVLKTTLGNFKGGNADSIIVEAGTGMIAQAELIGFRVGSARVSAFIQGFKLADTRTITFSRAFPDKISVTVDSFSIKASYKSEVMIVASLTTDNGGKPSVGQSVTFSVKQGLTTDDIGFFLNNQNTSTTSLDGKATIRFTAGDATYRGILTVSATAQKKDGTFLIPGTTKIFLTD